MKTLPIEIPGQLRTIARIFSEAGYQCWLVGGALRDGLLSRVTEDFDLATDAEPGQVMKLFRRTVPTGLDYGTVSILMGGRSFETTTFRADGTYRDGRRPDSVVFSTDIREDLVRRDFTINALAWNLVDNELIDPTGGQADLENGLIRAIGNPDERLKEDSLRTIRACRIAAELDFNIHPETIKAIRDNAYRTGSLSAERIRDELIKILRSSVPSRAFELFRETGILAVILPELAVIPEVKFRESLEVCNSVSSDNISLRLAALLWHGVELENQAKEILLRLKVPNVITLRVRQLLKHRFFECDDIQSDADVRDFIRRVSPELADDLVILKLAIEKSSTENQGSDSVCLDKFRLRLGAVLETKPVIDRKDLAIKGRDLMSELGLDASPLIKEVLQSLLDCVIQTPELNKKDILLDLAREWLKGKS